MRRQTVLITGGSRGIGAAMSRAFAQAGYAVAINYHKSAPQAQALAEEIVRAGGQALPVQADVGDPAQVRQMLDEVIAQLGQLDVLVCNAGVAHSGLLCDLTDEGWTHLRQTDLDGVLYCCRAAYSHMVGRKYGRIITVSSIWGQAGASCEVAYSAVKAGVIGLTRALARELGPSGITVNCLAPGVIDTEMNGNLTEEALKDLAGQTPVGRLGMPVDVARAAVFLASPQAEFITGQVLGVDGGFC